VLRARGLPGGGCCASTRLAPWSRPRRPASDEDAAARRSTPANIRVTMIELGRSAQAVLQTTARFHATNIRASPDALALSHRIGTKVRPAAVVLPVSWFRSGTEDTKTAKEARPCGVTRR